MGLASRHQSGTIFSIFGRLSVDCSLPNASRKSNLMPQFSSFVVSPDQTDRLKGYIKIPQQIRYEVFGPFGQGYNIRVVGFSGDAELNFCVRDGPGAQARTPQGRYEMSEDSVYDSKRTKVLELKGDEVTVNTSDILALSLFIVNHYYWLKTGPFDRSNR